MEVAKQPRQGRRVVHARQRLADTVAAAIAEGNVPLDVGGIRLPHLQASKDTLWMLRERMRRATKRDTYFVI